MRILRLLPLLLLVSTGASALQLEPYTFKANDGTEIAAELGSIKVPELHGVTNDKTLVLRFVRFKSTNPNPGHPIVYLAGGPGGSGIDTARRERFPLFMRLREVADVIAFDQRGTGMSNSTPACTPQTQYPVDKPLLEADFLTAMKAMAAECAAEWRAAGINLDVYNTKENAADLKTLQQALGAKKLNLWAISYGTHLALATAKYHPQIIDRMILASSEGLDQTVKLPSRVDLVLHRFAELIATDAQTKQKYPDFLATMRRVHQALETKPVQVTVKDPRGGEVVALGIGKLDVQLLASYLIKNPQEAAMLPAIYSAMDAGHFDAIAPHLLGMRQYFKRWQVMATAMDAASGISPQRWQQVQGEAPGALLGRASNLPFPDINTTLGITDLGDEFRAELRSDVPTLFLAGTLDGRTVLESQKELADRFNNATWLPVKNAGHDLFLSSPQVIEVMSAFLQGKAPAKRELQIAPPIFR